MADGNKIWDGPRVLISAVHMNVKGIELKKPSQTTAWTNRHGEQTWIITTESPMYGSL